MSEIMPAAWRRNASLAAPDDISILLLELSHPSLAEPIRVASQPTDVVSNGFTYIGCPVLYRLPGKGEQPKRGSIGIQNVSGELGSTARQLRGNDVAVVMTVVSRDNPDDVILRHEGLFLRNIEGDDAFISADVLGFGSDNQAWPKSTNSPERTPGAFV